MLLGMAMSFHKILMLNYAKLDGLNRYNDTGPNIRIHSRSSVFPDQRLMSHQGKKSYDKQ